MLTLWVILKSCRACRDPVHGCILQISGGVVCVNHMGSPLTIVVVKILAKVGATLVPMAVPMICLYFFFLRDVFVFLGGFRML